MESLVVLQSSLCTKAFPTVTADFRPFTSMNPVVLLQLSTRFGFKITNLTEKFDNVLSDVLIMFVAHVMHKLGFVWKSLSTVLTKFLLNF